MEEYESREFCRSIDCVMQIGLDRGVEEEVAKKYCHEFCSAYKFHQWLKDNDYRIIKTFKKSDKEVVEK